VNPSGRTGLATNAPAANVSSVFEPAVDDVDLVGAVNQAVVSWPQRTGQDPRLARGRRARIRPAGG
jgi:hypothetical protein